MKVKSMSYDVVIEELKLHMYTYLQILYIVVIYRYRYVRKWKGKKVGTMFSVGSYLAGICLEELHH